MKKSEADYVYVDGGGCVDVKDPMHSNTDEDMSDAEWERFLSERPNKTAASQAA